MLFPAVKGSREEVRVMVILSFKRVRLLQKKPHVILGNSLLITIERK